MTFVVGGDVKHNTYIHMQCILASWSIFSNVSKKKIIFFFECVLSYDIIFTFSKQAFNESLDVCNRS